MTTTPTSPRQVLAERFHAVRAMTETLAAPLSAEDQTVQSMPDASPTKWHRAHTTWFFETFLLLPFAPAYEAFDPRFGYLFNSYYDAVGERHPRAARGVVSRPGIEEIAAYRAHIDEWLGDFLDCGLPEELAELLELGLHHEQQHQELLIMDVHHALGSSITAGAYGPLPWATGGSGLEGWRSHEGGLLEVGHEGPGFAFDNEGPRHRVLLDPFELRRGLVTNAEVLAFMEDDGYRRPELWMSEGFATAMVQGWEAPMSWRALDDGWAEHTLDGLVPLELDAPARHLSWFEADALGRWAGCRLPTEHEWETLAPEPGEHPDDEAFYASVWQWTASPYVAYPGFRPAPGAVGEYNGKFMVNQMVLRGSSLATPPGHARRTYRNFFAPSARWVFAGVRLARDL